MRKLLFSLSVSCLSLSFAAVPASAQQAQPDNDAGEDALCGFSPAFVKWLLAQHGVPPRASSQLLLG